MYYERRGRLPSHRLGVAPKAFQLIVGARFFGKNVDQAISVVDQHPLGVLVSFHVERLLARGFEPNIDFVCDGLNLARVGAAANDKVIGEGEHLTHIQGDDVAGLFGFRGADRGEPVRLRVRLLLGPAQYASPAFILLHAIPFLYNRRFMSSLRVLISSSRIQARILELGAEIDRDYPQGPVYLIAILKGACFFLADLARAMKTPTRIEFVGISSYGKGRTSSGEVKLTKDLDVSVEGYDVVVVEDIVDSGVTLNYLLKVFAQRRPKSLRIATLLDKPERRQSPVQVHYVGFKIPDEFVVGFGLDYAEDYRNLKDVCVLEE